MGFENIADNNGIGIAVTGMVIVFTALTLITVFIALLPRILEALAPYLPDEHDHHHGHAAAAAPAPTSDDAEIAAGIAFVMHQLKQTKN